MWSVIWWQWRPVDMLLLVLSRRRLVVSYTQCRCRRRWCWFLGEFLKYFIFLSIIFKLKRAMAWNGNAFTTCKNLNHFYCSILVMKKREFRQTFSIYWIWPLKCRNLVWCDRWMFMWLHRCLCGSIASNTSLLIKTWVTNPSRERLSRNEKNTVSSV